MSFAAPQEFTVRYDPRRLAQLVTTSGDPHEDLPNQFDVESSPLVFAALGDATEIICAACQVGGFYRRADLENLALDYSSASHTGRGGLLVRLCCDIAYALLVGGK